MLLCELLMVYSLTAQCKLYAAAGSLMKCDKRTQNNIKEKKNTVEKIHKMIKKTRSINVREQHSIYKVLFQDSVDIRR